MKSNVDTPQPIAQPACTSLAAVARADHFADQHGARGPFAAETQPHQSARPQQLREVLRERAGQRKNREPQNRDLQGLHAADAIGQHSRRPAADRRTQQRDRADQSRIAARDAPCRDQRRNHEAQELCVHCIEHVADLATPERALLGSGDLPIPRKWAFRRDGVVVALGVRGQLRFGFHA
jgi:hypothetical protein